MSTTPINGSGTTTPTTAPQSTDPLANQNVFLQLLVAQLKYQDPQNPADGTQFITQLRRLQGYATTPIIAISGYDAKSGARQAHAAGAALFIPKPFTAHDIAAAVRHVLKGHKDRPSERQAT